MSTQTIEPAIDAKEAAKILNLHPGTVLRMARAHELPSFRIGRIWRFRASALDEWMRAQINSSTLPLAPSSKGAIQ